MSSMESQAQPKRVKVLSEEVANKIAAGEVVERPASVLKELVENSLDAKASRISVEVQGGGRNLIRVVDNGLGMEPDDLLLALERHATSKVVDAEDLLNVATLGFRGEALPSVAAVSKLTLRSRTSSKEAASQVFVAGGIIKDLKEVGAPLGTLVMVQDIFFNTPARRKFLKSQNTENSHLTAAMMRLALAQPEVAFSYKTGSRILYDLNAVKDLSQRVASLLGRDTARQMVRLEQKVGPLTLKGLTGMPSLSRSGYDGAHVFVNGRHVRDKVLMHAIGEAYKGLLPDRRKPVMVLHITMDPSLVDVNVHPAKTEVRFRNQQEVHMALAQGLRLGLAHAQNAVASSSYEVKPQNSPSNSFDQTTGINTTASRPLKVSEPTPNLYRGRNFSGLAPTNYTKVEYTYDNDQNTRQEVVPQTGSPKADAKPLFEPISDITVLGQLHNLYIICAWPKGLLIIDQHAACERVAYDRMRKSFEQGRALRQGLLTPVTLDLTPVEANWAETQAPHWLQLGLELEHFGGSTWAIRAIPPMLMGVDPAPVVKDLLAEMAQSGISLATPEFFEVGLRSLACRSSIKAGQHLSHEELKDLAEKVAKLPPPVTCPHGRPVVISLTAKELTRLFKRSEA